MLQQVELLYPWQCGECVSMLVYSKLIHGIEVYIDVTMSGKDFVIVSHNVLGNSNFYWIPSCRKVKMLWGVHYISIHCLLF